MAKGGVGDIIITPLIIINKNNKWQCQNFLLREFNQKVYY